MIHTNNFLNRPMSQKGFSIIELLLIIALLGILSAIILGSVMEYRQKAKDTKIKQVLSDFSTYAERYSVDNADSYDGLCSSSEAKRLLDGAFLNSPIARSISVSDCISDDNEYIVAVPLNQISGSVYCIDAKSTKLVVHKSLPVLFSNNAGSCNDYSNA